MDTLKDQQSTIGENEVNIEKTEQLQNDLAFKTFMAWCNQNKLFVHENIIAPAAFGPLGIPGIAAKEDIPANTVIAAIPDKLLITLKAIKHGELQEIFKCSQDKELFDEDKAGDAEFNIIATFLIYEKCKDGKSFFQPYFDTIQRSYTMYDWNEEEVKDTECPELIDEFKHYLEDMNQTWSDLRKCLLKYPKFFKEEQLTKEIFLWSYELIMTRIFGYSLPCTCLVPFGDLFNHGNHSATHYIVNKRFEEDEQLAHKDYKIKKHKIDISIFGDDTGKYRVESNDYHFRSRRFRFVKHHYKQLPDELKNSVDWQKQNYIEDQPLREMMYEINARKLQENKEANIWDLDFFTTSATEDNDTDEEQTEQRKKEYDILFNKELKIVETAFKRSKDGSDPKLNLSNSISKNYSELNNTNILGTSTLDQTGNHIQHKRKQSNSSSSSGFEGNDDEEEDDEYEEDDEEEEQEDEEQKQVEVQKEEQEEQKEESIEQDNNENKQKEVLSKEKKFADEEIIKEKKKVIKIEHDKYEYEEGSVSSLSDDSKWDWYETQHENTYFAVTTEQPQPKFTKYYKNIIIESDNYIYNLFLSIDDGTFIKTITNEYLKIIIELRKENKFFFVMEGEQINSCYNGMDLPTNKTYLIALGLEQFIKFDMWIRPDPHGLENNVEDIIIFRKFISESDWQNGFIMNNSSKILTKDLTKEFRLKKGHLCEEFIVYLRIYLSSHYKGMDISQILFTLPRSLGFEKFIFSFAKRILQSMRNKYSTTIEEDQEVLKDESISYKKRFATVLKIDHKQLLDEQISIVETVFRILDRLEKHVFVMQQQLTQEQTTCETTLVQDTENKENEQFSYTQIYNDNKSLDTSKISSDVQTTKLERVLTDEDTNTLKVHYMHNFENFANYKDLLKERHKIKKYLEQLFIGKYKQYTI